MKRTRQKPNDLPRHDYHLALQSAVSWLGDRYLLAQPARRIEAPKPFFVETRSWHDSPRGNGTRGRRH